VEHFGGLPPEKIRATILSGGIRKVQAEQVMFLESEPSAGSCVLLSGRVQICTLSPQGQPSIVSIFEPVIMFNEVAVLDGGPNAATAIALEDSILWHLAPTALEDMLLRYPRVAMVMLRVLANRKWRLVSLFEDLTFHPVLARSAKLLLELSQQGAQPISRRHHPNHRIASQIATVREAFSRSLSVFKEAGAIQVDKNAIHVLDLSYLLEIAQIYPKES
jgi:CRP/FNR family transcriptional regulator